jgi:hypothetical protein
MSKNKKSLSLINAAVILSLGVFSANSYAEAKFTPKFEIGYGSYELELTQRSEPFFDENGNEQTTLTTETAVASFITYAVGGSISFDNLMVDLTYKGSVAGEQDYLNGADLCGYTDDTSCGVNYNNDGDFEHTEIAATLGYQIGSFAIFGGYQTGETTLDHNFTLIAQEDNPWGYDPGEDITQDAWGVDLAEKNVVNETAGFFLGAGYGFAVGASSSINLSAGYTLFDVELKEKWNHLDWTQTSSGDGSGISVAAIYNYHFTNSRLYFKFDFQAYTQENFSNYEYDDGDDPSEFSPADASENYYRFSVGYAF